MSANNSASTPLAMPHVDFGSAFRSPDDPPPPHSESSPQPLAPGENKIEPIEPSKFRQSRLGRSDWANIIFVIIAVLGGLFCAFYFFNGAEVLRAAGAWPREFLYARPFASVNHLKIDSFPRSTEETAPDPSKPSASRQRGPFSRPISLVALNEPPSPQALIQASVANSGDTSGTPLTPPGIIGSGGGAGGGGSLIGGLPLPPPGGDTLLQTLNKAVADLQRTIEQNARRTVMVVETTVKRITKKPIPAATGTAATSTTGTIGSATTTTKNLTQRAQAGIASASSTNPAQTVATTASTAATTTSATTGQAGNTVGATQTQVGNTISSTGSTLQSGLGNVRAITSNPMRGLGGLGGGGLRAPVSIGGHRH